MDRSYPRGSLVMALTAPVRCDTFDLAGTPSHHLLSNVWVGHWTLASEGWWWVCACVREVFPCVWKGWGKGCYWVPYHLLKWVYIVITGSCVTLPYTDFFGHD